jgi:hypothetical protein
MLLFRDAEQNTRKARISWLKTALLQQLSHVDPKFLLGMVGTSLVPARFLALPLEAQLGEQLMLSFWAFGDTEPLVMQNLSRLMRNLTQAIRAVSARIVASD